MGARPDVKLMAAGDLVDELFEMRTAEAYWNANDRDLAMAARCRQRAMDIVQELNRRPGITAGTF